MFIFQSKSRRRCTAPVARTPAASYPFLWVLVGLVLISPAFSQPPSDGDRASQSFPQILASAVRQIGADGFNQEAYDLLAQMLAAPLPDRNRLYLPIPPRARRADTPKVDLPASIRTELDTAAAALIQEAAQAQRQGHSARTYRLLFQTLALDPQQKDALRILAPTWEALQQRRITAQVNQPFALTNWPARSYSSIVTPHFKIVSQAPQRISDELATFCEQTYCVWQQLFFDYWCDPTKFSERLRGRDIPLERDHNFQVVLFRDREAYQKALSTVEANIGVSTGYYSPKMRTSFFYFETDKSWPTIAHELTHQFFQEAGRAESKLDTDTQPDFWSVEAIAMYMESMSRRNGIDCKIVEVGGWDAPRLQAARYRRAYEEFWIPWDELQKATGAQFRKGAELPLWYSHSAGLAHFWMDSSDARRDAFAKYLAAVYQRQSTDGLLADANRDEDLRANYDRFIIPTRMQVAARQYTPERQDFVLSKTAVDSDTLLQWTGPMRRCQWLDLAFTKIDDQLFLKSSQTSWDCVRLNLEGTQITDAALPAIAAMPRLEELDLSRCAVTDEGIKSLQRHRTLKTLWLTNTRVTDASLPTLETLTNLTNIDIRGTPISPTEWQKTSKKLPRLKR